MSASKWDFQEVKRLKWKQLVQHNVIMLLLFLLAVYYVKSVGTAFFLLIFFCSIIWLFFLHSLYTLKTGKVVGTKTMKAVYAYDKDLHGAKRQKRKKIVEAVIIGLVGIVCTVIMNFSYLLDATVAFSNLVPFIGAWVGMNIGEFFRISSM